jgi:hypothetical protein
MDKLFHGILEKTPARTHQTVNHYLNQREEIVAFILKKMKGN